MIKNPDPVLTAITTDLPSAGEYVPSRDLCTGTVVSISSGGVYLNYFTADKTELVSNLSIITSTTAAAATPTICRMGVYSVAANGNLTLVGSTANDTTLFAAASTLYAKAVTTPFTKVAGQRYATAFIVVSGAATPTFIGVPYVASGAVSNMLFDTPTKAARVNSQSDLPSSVSVGSLVAGRERALIRLY